MKLSHTQLLLLDILIFMIEDDSFLELTVAEASNLARKNVIDGNNKTQLALTTDEELLSVLDFIDSDKNLCEYKIVQYLNNNDLRVVMFVGYKYLKLPFLNKVTNKIISYDVNIIFCGTITANGWIDNGIGSYEPDTYAQLTANQFITDLPRKFRHNITVSGHSKGGNLSMYTTLLNKYVDRGVSFDGQGFSGEFIQKYDKEIIKNKHKIITISDQNDPVSAIGINPSQYQYFLETEKQLNPFCYHKPTILLSSEGVIEENNKNNTRTSSIDYIHEIYIYIETLPKEERKEIADLFINTLKILFNTKDGTENIIKTLKLIPGFTKIITNMEFQKLLNK